MKPGDIVTLKDYGRYADYSVHDSQAAEYVGFDASRSGMPHHVRWADGSTSYVASDNLVAAKGGKKGGKKAKKTRMLQVGDRVRVRDTFAGRSMAGAVGTVVGIQPDGYYNVNFDQAFNGGHDCGGVAQEGRGRNGPPHELEYIKGTARAAVKKLDMKALAPLVLKEETKKEIVAVLKQHEHSHTLFEEWGLGKVLEYGRGMSLMFYGPPGTGKTWGATCIAKALGTELLIISAADIQSSEPGGANRSIQQAFRTAKEEKKVLFIDECDSLITTRTDLGMILASEVNTLLTEIERSEGVTILATNRIDTMDTALERRLALIVEFPFPEKAERIQIWQTLLPKKYPLEADVHIETLADYELTGGLIKNAILQAGRLALAEGNKVVSKADFERAIERIKKSGGLMGQTSRYHQGRDGVDVAPQHHHSHTMLDTGSVGKIGNFLTDFGRASDKTNQYGDDTDKT